MTGVPQMDSEDVLRARLAVVRQEHRDLDDAIAAMEGRPVDALTLRRLKKRKLMLKERIVALEDKLTPDIIA